MELVSVAEEEVQIEGIAWHSMASAAGNKEMVIRDIPVYLLVYHPCADASS